MDILLGEPKPVVSRRPMGCSISLLLYLYRPEGVEK